MIVSCRSCLAHLESLARESKVHITKEVFLVGRVQKVSGQQRETCPNFSAAGFTNDLVIQQKFVSRHHSCICHHGTTWEIRDCHSLCGVYVNRKKIDGSSPLKTGDEIWFGAKEERFLFKSFLLDEAPPSAEPIESAKQLLTSLGVDKKKAYLNFLHSVTCPICKDVLCYPILTNCQHLMCCSCFSDCSTKQCPLCKSEITQISYAVAVDQIIYDNVVQFMSRAKLEGYKHQQESASQEIKQPNIGRASLVPESIKECDWFVSRDKLERLRFFAKEAASLGLHLVSLSEAWTEEQRETFFRGLMEYSYGAARKLFFDLVSAKDDFADPQKVAVMLSNLGLLPTGDAAAELSRFITYGSRDEITALIDSEL